MINDQGEVCLGDMGIARAIHTTMGPLTQAGGTSRYMAPELFVIGDAARITHATDMYSFAMTFYEVITLTTW